MKKVLILSSSPRKGGNSDILCDEFSKGASESGHQVEKIFLKDKNINYCTGCGYCNTTGQSGCSQKDDAIEIVQKMTEADVIVMATPVYFYTMCAQMKTLIDRCCSMYTKISGKEFYFILTAADDNKAALERTVVEFGGFLACLSNAKQKGVIYATGVWQKGDVRSADFPEIALQTGRGV